MGNAVRFTGYTIAAAGFLIEAFGSGCSRLLSPAPQAAVFADLNGERRWVLLCCWHPSCRGKQMPS